MRVRFHTDVDEFASFAVPLYERDPVLHTIELSLLRRTLYEIEDPLLITVWADDHPVGAALQTPPQPLLCTGLPPRTIAAVVDEVSRVQPELPGVRGVRDVALEFARRWREHTQRTWTAPEVDRLYRLGTPRWPSPTGTPRLAGAADHVLLVEWVCAFVAEAFGRDPDPQRAEEGIRAAIAAGNVYVLLAVDGVTVSLAGVRRPAWGAARIGPVYTPKELRGNGYGSAVTAEAARWAQSVGAEEVVLFADLANPVSNAIYQRMGFEPVADTLNVAFTG